MQTATRARARLERVAAVWENAGMSDLPRVHATGLITWCAILLELLRRERDGEGSSSVLGLSKAIGKSDRQTKEHLSAMARAGMVTVVSQMGYHGSEVSLTELGRLVARIAEVSTK